MLVVATAAVETAPAVEAVAAARSRAGGADVLVMAPALNSTVSHWLSDLRRARLGAQERLAVSLAVLATANVEARGSVGDSDPVQATEDTLRSFPAAEVVLVTRPRARREARARGSPPARSARHRGRGRCARLAARAAQPSRR